MYAFASMAYFTLTRQLQFAQAVDYYLSPTGQTYIPDIHCLARQPPSDETDNLLLGYVMEGIRLAGPRASYREALANDIIKESDGREVPIKNGDRVIVSSVSSDCRGGRPNATNVNRSPGMQADHHPQISAARDPNHFPSPEEVNPRRPLSAYIFRDVGAPDCLGRDAGQVALAEMFRALFRRKNVRRVPGPQGELKKVPYQSGSIAYLSEDWRTICPFPTSMKVMWDED